MCLINCNPIYSFYRLFPVNSLKQCPCFAGINIFNEVGYVLISAESFIKELLPKCPKTTKCFIGEELPRALPSFKPLDDGIAAIYDSCNAGYINPRSYIAANKLLASQNGCEMIEDVVSEVRASDDTDNDDELDEAERLSNSRRHLIARTKSGRLIRARRVLLCPGAFVNFENLLPNGTEIDISTNSETAVLVEVQHEDVERLSSLPCWGFKMKDRRDARNSYILPAIKYPDGKNWGNYY